MIGAGRAVVVLVAVAAALHTWKATRVAPRVCELRPQRHRRRVTAADVARIPSSLGAALRRVLGRPAEPGADRWWGLGLLAVIALALIGPVPVLVTATAVWGARWQRRRRGRRRHDDEVRAAMPDAVDLLRLGAEAGLTVFQALTALARHGEGPIAVRSAQVLVRVERGARLADALEGLRSDPLTAPLADALIDAERYGTPLAGALERIAGDARLERREQAERLAHRLPVRLLFPLVLCILPALGVLVVVPLVVVALDGLAL